MIGKFRPEGGAIVLNFVHSPFDQPVNANLFRLPARSIFEREEDEAHSQTPVPATSAALTWKSLYHTSRSHMCWGLPDRRTRPG